jgi:uncharacterized membrane protein YgcG
MRSCHLPIKFIGPFGIEQETELDVYWYFESRLLSMIPYDVYDDNGQCETRPIPKAPGQVIEEDVCDYNHNGVIDGQREELCATGGEEENPPTVITPCDLNQNGIIDTEQEQICAQEYGCSIIIDGSYNVEEQCSSSSSSSSSSSGGSTSGGSTSGGSTSGGSTSGGSTSGGSSEKPNFPGL